MSYQKRTNNPKMGRPTDLPLTHDIRVRIDEGTYSKILNRCQREGINTAELIRAALKDYLK